MRNARFSSPRTKNWTGGTILIAIVALTASTASAQAAHNLASASLPVATTPTTRGPLATLPPSPTIEAGTRLDPASTPLTSVEEIARRVAASESQRQAALRHYESERTYHLEYTGIGGLHIADLVVRAEYDAPGVKHLTIVRQTGSKGFGDKVLRKLVESEEEASQRENRKEMAFTTENFEMHLVGHETVEGVPAYVLDVKPRIENRFAYNGRVWISMNDFAIVQVQGSPAKEPTWMVNSMGFNTRYVHAGSFWLPQHNQTITHVIMGGEVKITIDYGTYKNIVASPHSMDYASVVQEK